MTSAFILVFICYSSILLIIIIIHVFGLIYTTRANYSLPNYGRWHYGRAQIIEKLSNVREALPRGAPINLSSHHAFVCFTKCVRPTQMCDIIQIKSPSTITSTHTLNHKSTLTIGVEPAYSTYLVCVGPPIMWVEMCKWV